MAVQDAERLLATATDAEITELMLATTPWIFEGDAGAFTAWRRSVATASFSITPDSLFIVGSASLGYSLSPSKPGRPFRRGNESWERSDIDVAIVSYGLFTQTWDQLIESDRRHSLGGSPDERTKVRTDVYWGHIISSRIPLGTAPSRLLRGVLATTTAQRPFRGHIAKARVYRRHIDLVSYHLQSLRALRAELKAYP